MTKSHKSKELVVIDGANVAWVEKDKKGRPQLKNIELVLNQLNQYGY